jgi:hypothetical protein
VIRKEIRQQKIRLRKNFLPTLMVIVFLWGMVATIVYFGDPEASGILVLFFFIIFLASLFTASTILSNTRRGVITSAALTSFLILRYFGVGSILNFFLIAGISVAFEFYFFRR